MIINTSGLTRFEVLRVLVLRAILERDVTLDDVVWLNDFPDNDVDAIIAEKLTGAEKTENFNILTVKYKNRIININVDLTNRTQVDVTAYDKVYGPNAGKKALEILRKDEYRLAKDFSGGTLTPLCWSVQSSDGSKSRSASSVSYRPTTPSSPATLSPPTVMLYSADGKYARSLDSMSNRSSLPSPNAFSLSSVDRVPSPNPFEVKGPGLFG